VVSGVWRCTCGCEECEREFERATYWQKYCGEACRRAAQNAAGKRGRELVKAEREAAGKRAA